MPTKLETQAAEAKCPLLVDGVHFQVGLADGTVTECDICQGTTLRWRTLSRACPISTCPGPKTHDALVRSPCSVCNGSGRIPDVTLEKLFDCGVIGVWLAEERGGFEAVAVGAETAVYGDTPKDAACAALLASTPAVTTQ